MNRTNYNNLLIESFLTCYDRFDSQVILANGPQEGVSDCISPYCIDQEVEIEKYDVVYIENKIPSMVLLVKPNSSEYVALSK
mgnify:CR=1 FL=1